MKHFLTYQMERKENLNKLGLFFYLWYVRECFMIIIIIIIILKTLLVMFAFLIMPKYSMTYEIVNKKREKTTSKF